MKIIDCHFHFAGHEYFTESALASGHQNTAAHLREVFAANRIETAVVMGTRWREDSILSMPGLPEDLPDFMHFCAGVDSGKLTMENRDKSAALFEPVLREENCCGLKFYMGYNAVYIDDPRHDPLFELAQSLNKPVVIHTGETAGHHGRLKYAHPLTVDDVASRFPEVNFVMAHCGNPWFADAAAVAAKNPNVYLDLSGLVVGRFEVDDFMKQYAGYLGVLQTWLAYLSDYRKVMYGSDWPLVNLADYIELMRRMIPEAHHEDVFYSNAKRLFQL